MTYSRKLKFAALGMLALAGPAAAQTSPEPAYLTDLDKHSQAVANAVIKLYRASLDQPSVVECASINCARSLNLPQGHVTATPAEPLMHQYPSGTLMVRHFKSEWDTCYLILPSGDNVEADCLTGKEKESK